MENKTSANINMNSYGKEFSSTPKQMEHQKAMTQENHDYQLKMQKAQHDHEISMRNMDLGKVGWIFGSSDNSSEEYCSGHLFHIIIGYYWYVVLGVWNG